jgi:hypothetical protein
METVQNAIKRIIHTDPNVELLSYYKSYPVSIRSNIQSFENGVICLTVNPPGSVCLYQNKTAILLSNNLHDAIRARVVRFEIGEGRAELSNLAYIGPWVGRRMIVRVQPGQSLPVSLDRDGMVIRGRVADISLTGIGVMVTNPIVKKEDHFTINIQLPEGNFSVPGKIVEVTALIGFNRLAIKFMANNKQIALILKYISNRREELQTEVQQLFDKVYKTAKI